MWFVVFIVVVILLLLVCLIFCATKMSSIQDLKEQAEILGLKGDDIAKFVLQQQAYQREERAREREEREKERQREERESEHKIKLAEIQANKEIELARVTAPSQPISDPVVDPVSRPKLPLLQDGEDINSYLNRFERVAELLNVRQDSYAVRLGSLLTGKAYFVR